MVLNSTEVPFLCTYSLPRCYWIGFHLLDSEKTHQYLKTLFFHRSCCSRQVNDIDWDRHWKAKSVTGKKVMAFA